jgi:Ras-related GTP-binding protein C/D
MESRIIARRPSAPLAGESSRQIAREVGGDGAEQIPAQSSASSSLLDPRAQLTIERFLQDLPNAEQPPQEFPPQYHTGRMPNSKAGDGKPRLLLMGQRR